MKALVEIGEALRTLGYSFVTVTPETHRRVVARDRRRRAILTDVFGWSLPFEDGELPEALFGMLRDGGYLGESAHGYTSAIRFASLEGGLYAHSSFPTGRVDSVFFGPDTYRFCRAIRRAARAAEFVVDVGCGSGAGGIVAGGGSERLQLVDVNATALTFARANAELNRVRHAEVIESDVLSQVSGSPDLIVSNPPYLRDALARTYRDGGGRHGEALSLRILDEALRRLRPGGTLLLYTGSAIVSGADTFFEAAAVRLGGTRCRHRYEEIDPDVFGEELADPAYADVDRIAAVVLEVTLE